MINTITVLFVVLILFTGFSKLKTINYNKKYVLKVEKINAFFRDNEEYLVLKVVLKNNSKDTLMYKSMSCSFSDYYSVSNNTFKIVKENCLRNTEIILKLAPYEENEVELTLLKNKNIKTNLNTFQIILNLVKVRDSDKKSNSKETHTSKRKNKIFSNAIEIFNHKIKV